MKGWFFQSKGWFFGRKVRVIQLYQGAQLERHLATVWSVGGAFGTVLGPSDVSLEVCVFVDFVASKIVDSSVVWRDGVALGHWSGATWSR